MLDKVRHTVQKFGMLNPGDHVIVAVSGGPDSVALLRVLLLLSAEYDLTLTVAHLNHGLRGAESDAEEELVRRLCREGNILCAVKGVDLRVLQARGNRQRSLEDLGREERYAFFSALAAEAGASRIALGHHREDQAETLLINLIRGSGLAGLKGILPLRDGCFIRPLLEVSRQEILTFLSAENLPFLEDSSNREDQFLRNRIRHRLIPLLKKDYNPKIIDMLNRTAGILRREDDCLKAAARRILDEWQLPDLPGEGEATIDISRMVGLHEALQYRVIKALLERWIVSPSRITAAHIEAVMALCHGRKPNGRLSMPGQVAVRREYGKISFYREAENRPAAKEAGEKGQCGEKYFYWLNIPDRVEVRELGRIVITAFTEEEGHGTPAEVKSVAYMDYDKVRMPLAIRNRREGDRFQPLGMAGTKKLKTFFIDEKVPRRRRDSLPLVADRHSVLWITGLRLSERVRVDRETRRIVKIEII